MRELTTFIMSWLAVSAIFFIALFFDDLSLSALEVREAVLFLCIVSFVSAIYFIIIGVPALYLMLRKKSVSRAAFFIAGMVASFPMLIFCIYSGELEWVLATVVAGFISGGIFALRLANQQRT